MSVARLMQMAAAGSAGAGPEPSGWTDPDLANASYDSVSFAFGSQDPSPTCVIFSADGLRMYSLGFSTDTVYQYSLSIAWDISTASYGSVSLPVGAQDATPTGVRFDATGSKLFIVGTTSDSVHQYSLTTSWDISTASYDSVSFNVGAQQNSPYDLSFNTTGTKMYILGLQDDTAYQYTLSTGFDVSTASYDSVSFSVTSEEGAPMGLAFNPDGTKMFVIGFSSDSVHQYSLSTGFDLSTASYDSVSFSVAGQEISPRSIAFKSDGSKMYVAGVVSGTIYQYSTAATPPAEWTDPDLANASYDSVSFSVAAQTNFPVDLVFSNDGNKMYVLGITNTVYQYSLSTAFNVGTASYDSVSFSVAGQALAGRGICFNNDGTKMYAVGTNRDVLYQYTLSTAFNLSTASYSGVSFSVAGQDTSPNSMAFGSDGTKMYMVGASTGSIYQYSLSTAFNVGTASYDSVNFSVAGQDTTPYDLVFNPDGTKMYIMGNATDRVYQYSLSTGFDLSTASYDSVSFLVSAQETSPYALAFKSDGSKMYIAGSTTDTIYQYSTA